MNRLHSMAIVILVVLTLRASSELQTTHVRTALASNEAKRATHYNLYPMSSIRVIDGDTIQGDISIGYDVVLKGKTIRFKGYDAWEVSTHRQTVKVTVEEIKKGREATTYLTDFVSNKQIAIGEAVLSPDHALSKSTDSYGRLVAEIYYLATPAGAGNVATWKPLAPLLQEQGFSRVDNQDSNKGR